MRTPDRNPGAAAPWSTMSDWLISRMPAFVDVPQMVEDQRIVYGNAEVVRIGDPYRPHTFVWFHRDLPDETPVPGEILVIHQDERLVVVDKPPFLSSIPRGQHIQQSAVVRLRLALGLPELTPLHRLDRVTSGLLMLSTERQWRGPYQSLFQHREVSKTYRALAKYRADLQLPTTVRNHLTKPRGSLQAEVVAGARVNAETFVECESVDGAEAVYRLTPATGQTHQLRVHMFGLGVPIFGDPLYPVVQDVEIGDFSRPLQLLAAQLSFIDPIDGIAREFHSARTLPC